MKKKIDVKSLVQQSTARATSPRPDKFDVAETAMAGRTKGLTSPERQTPGFGAETKDATPIDVQVLSVPIAHVHDNPFNARYIYDPEIVKELALSLATHGQYQPASAVPHKDLPGHYVLIDGHYRKRGLLSANKNEIVLQVQDVTEDLEMYRRSFAINNERSAQTPLDNAMAWQRLIDLGLMKDGEAIGELLGISKANVSRTLAFLRLPEPALDKIREAPTKFQISVGYELALCAALMSESELLQLMDRIVAEDLSSRQVEALRSTLAAKTDRKPKEISRQYKLQVDGRDIGVVKNWDLAGKVTLEVSIADPKEREALVEDLRRRLCLSPPCQGGGDSGTVDDPAGA